LTSWVFADVDADAAEITALNELGERRLVARAQEDRVRIVERIECAADRGVGEIVRTGARTILVERACQKLIRILIDLLGRSLWRGGWLCERCADVAVLEIVEQSAPLTRQQKPLVHRLVVDIADLVERHVEHIQAALVAASTRTFRVACYVAQIPR